MGRRSDASAFVNRKISMLKTKPSSEVSAALAELRRGAGKEPGSNPLLWEWTLDGLPDDGFGAEPSYLETSVYLAMTLFSVHQQGNDVQTKCMSVSSVRFGEAVRRLCKNEDDIDRMIKKIKSVTSADSITSVAYYLRQLISLLKSNGIGFDYADLAGDLYEFQFEEGRDRIVLKWARDFYKTKKIISEEE